MVGGAPADQAPAYVSLPLHTADLIAVNALGQFADHPRIAVLREFITGWHVSNLLIEDTRDLPVAGLQEHLSKTGDNLANVVQYLSDKHPDRLAEIFRTLARRVPLLEKAITQELADGRLLLAIKDVPFNDPIAARFVSDGTLKLLAYLVLLHDPDPPHFIGIEEPENFLHPRLMYPLAEDFRTASERSQLLVTTHSPYFLNAMRPEEVRVLVSRQSRLHSGSACRRHLWRKRVHGARRATRRSLDGRALQRWRPALEFGYAEACRRALMTLKHLEALVEEPSMEALLTVLLPKLIGDATFRIYAHTSKDILLGRLASRLKAYRQMLQPGWVVLVLIDQDDDDCQALKRSLEREAAAADLISRTGAAGGVFTVLIALSSKSLRLGISATGRPFARRTLACLQELPRARRIAIPMRSAEEPGKRSSASCSRPRTSHAV